jgi:hypothetical protein
MLRVSPWATPGGVGLLQLCSHHAGSLDALLAHVCGRGVHVGAVALRTVGPLDDALIARISPTIAMVMPHGGLALLREIESLFASHGAVEPTEREVDPRVLFPEARSEVDARALLALAHSVSPLAAECLLAQHARWARVPRAATLPAACPLRHLLVPPVVVLRGAANIGKSTLLNALASHTVSVVADEPGTTRDHVGAIINCAGLAACVVDTPGVRSLGSDSASTIERAAQQQVDELLHRAELVLLCGTRDVPPPAIPPWCDAPVLRLVLRGDAPSQGSSRWQHEIALQGLHEPVLSPDAREALSHLARGIRDMLLPPALLTSEQPWQFWEASQA